MTGRERILHAFRGEAADRVPFAPNIYQWFHVHHANGTLPAELEGAGHPFDALRSLGADILARWDTMAATRETYSGGEFREDYTGDCARERWMVTCFNRFPPRANQCRRSFTSPCGVLTSTWTYSQEAQADFQSEYWWKSWDDYARIRYLLEAREYAFDAAEFRRWVARVGDDGLVTVHITQSPLKTFHWLAGAQNSTFFLADHPAEMLQLAKIHEEKALALLETIADLPEAELFMSLENLDSQFYSPRLYDQYCRSFFSRAAEIIHSRGKFFLVHACGRNRALLPLAGPSGIDCLEGLAPPPMGDVDLSQARRLAGNERFIVNGGMDAHHLEAQGGAGIEAYTRELFASLGNKRRFIFASSCATPPSAPWRNLVRFRDAARQYGAIW